jgi:hypothetical protein
MPDGDFKIHVCFFMVDLVSSRMMWICHPYVRWTVTSAVSMH